MRLVASVEILFLALLHQPEAGTGQDITLLEVTVAQVAGDTLEGLGIHQVNHLPVGTERQQ